MKPGQPAASRSKVSPENDQQEGVGCVGPAGSAVVQPAADGPVTVGELVEGRACPARTRRLLPRSTSSSRSSRIVLGRAAWMAARARMSRSADVVAMATAWPMSC
jgi:hypothetical protein